MRFFAVILSTLSLSAWASYKPADRYADYLDLAKHEKEGVDFKVETVNRHSSVTVIAIHGGHIEEGSDKLARAIAGSILSYYVFQGVKPKNNRALHVTSTHFNDPRALELVEKEDTVISIHGFKEDAKDEICIGGRNTNLRDEIAKSLLGAKTGVIVTVPCATYGGDDPQNIVNRSKKYGVQLEFSSRLRKRIAEDHLLRDKIATVIRSCVVHQN